MVNRFEDLLTNPEYEISVPCGHPAAMHPQDQLPEKAKPVCSKSSSDMHMLLTRRESPSQQGSHFDNPRHYDKSGSTKRTGPIYGACRMVDFREALAVRSDGLAITPSVIHYWEEQFGNRFNDAPLTWGIVGVRTLHKGIRAMTAPLQEFPYWLNPEAVQAFLDAIYRNTGMNVSAVLNEPASVDRVDQGHLLLPDPSDSQGGAHGAFGQHGIAIGEFFDLSAHQDGDTGIFYATRAAMSFDDSTPLAAARFLPKEKLR